MRWQASRGGRVTARRRGLRAGAAILAPWLRLPVLLPVTAVVAALTFPLLHASLAATRQLSEPNRAIVDPVGDTESGQGLAAANASLASLSANSGRLSGVAD
ncbi:MAG: hypothetical protein N2512_01280 [Armatimonadetes bacterium]|nr:hypothetical protein [Armatimonadota bacterium]